MVALGKALYAGEKCGYYSAQTNFYRRLDLRGNLEKKTPEKVETTSDGFLFLPGAGRLCDWVKIHKDLNKNLQRELQEVIAYLQSNHFKMKYFKDKTEFGRHHIDAVMDRGTIVVDLEYSEDEMIFPNKTVPLLELPKLFLGRKAKLKYMINVIPPTEEEKLSACEIDTAIKNYLGLR